MSRDYPIIGITARHRDRSADDGITALGNRIHFAVIGHSWAIVKCGALPVILPIPEEGNYCEISKRYLNMIDGLIITEGEDMSPSTYGAEKAKECSDELDERKDAFELEILRQACEMDMPILGICRGIHVLNVLFGGTLCQDIPTYFERNIEIRHCADGDERYRNFHNVRLADNSIVKRCYKKNELLVNSIHHQAIANLAGSLTPTAWSDDGVIEAVEMRDKLFVLALQWHPERIWDEEPIHLKVFEEFVVCARQYMMR
ncbi:MAG: gamma-glutamyl-gamma-aminobutyrate hydrolase family protein [Caulobacteraceae bacterium]